MEYLVHSLKEKKNEFNITVNSWKKLDMIQPVVPKLKAQYVTFQKDLLA